MKCIYCGEEANLADTLNVYMMSIDSPYLNLYVHLECYRAIQNYGELKFLQENLEKYCDEFKPSKKIKRK